MAEPESRARILALWWVACGLWSGGWLFLKIGLRDLPPLTFAAMRLGLALAVLSALVTWRKEWKIPGRAEAKMIVVSGLLLLGVNYALTFWGAQFLPSALTSVLQATSPLFGFLLGTATGSERFSAARAAVLPLGVIGVGLVSRAQFSTGDLSGAGTAAVVAGAAAAAAAYVVVKRGGTHVPPLLLSAAQTLCAFVPLSAVAVLFEGSPSDRAWTAQALAALLYLGIANSVVAFWLNYWLLQRMTTTTVLSMALMQPLIAAALGALLLDEGFSVDAALGGVCILISAGVILRRYD